MELKKYKLADIAKIEISGVDKKTIVVYGCISQANRD